MMGICKFVLSNTVLLIEKTPLIYRARTVEEVRLKGAGFESISWRTRLQELDRRLKSFNRYLGVLEHVRLGKRMLNI